MGVTLFGTVLSTDLGGSSKYSIEKDADELKTESGERFRVNCSRTRVSRS
jgi:hypothetical protein